jgi:hypothetical protein
VDEIRTTAEAVAAGMAGSPTLLVNGRDPFGPADGSECECGVACRIYRDEQGRPATPAQPDTARQDADPPSR